MYDPLITRPKGVWYLQLHPGYIHLMKPLSRANTVRLAGAGILAILEAETLHMQNTALEQLASNAAVTNQAVPDSIAEGWIWKTLARFVEQLLGIASEKNVGVALNLLVDNGYLERRDRLQQGKRTPKASGRPQYEYRLLIPAIQGVMNAYGSDHVKLRERSRKITGNNTYITKTQKSSASAGGVVQDLMTNALSWAYRQVPGYTTATLKKFVLGNPVGVTAYDENAKIFRQQPMTATEFVAFAMWRKAHANLCPKLPSTADALPRWVGEFRGHTEYGVYVAKAVTWVQAGNLDQAYYGEPKAEEPAADTASPVVPDAPMITPEDIAALKGKSRGKR